MYGCVCEHCAEKLLGDRYVRECNCGLKYDENKETKNKYCKEHIL